MREVLFMLVVLWMFCIPVAIVIKWLNGLLGLPGRIAAKLILKLGRGFASVGRWLAGWFQQW